MIRIHRIRKTLLALVAVFPLAASAAVSTMGSWTYSPWTGDSTTGISPENTIWAYNTGDTTSATVNGVTLPGVFTNRSGADVDITTTSTYRGATNSLTSLTGQGSAEIAKSFSYNGIGGPTTVVAKNLTVGKNYAISFFGIGFDEQGSRVVTFNAEGNSTQVDQNQYGYGKEIRVDFIFKAAAPQLTINLSETATNYSWGLNAVALRNSNTDLTVGTPVVNVPGATIASLAPTQMTDLTGKLYLRAKLKGVPSTENECILCWDGVTASAIVRKGVSIANGTIKSFGDPVTVPAGPVNDFIFFSAKLLRDESTITAANDDVTVALLDNGQGFTALLQEGQSDLLNGYTLTKVDWVHPTQYTGTWAGITLTETNTSTKKSALWNAYAGVVAYVGGPVEVNGSTKTIKSISKPTAKTPAAGQTRVGNDEDVAVLIRTVEGDTAIKRYSLPQD